MNDNLSASPLTAPPPASPLSGESNPLGRRIKILLQIQNRSNLILLLPGGGELRYSGKQLNYPDKQLSYSRKSPQNQSGVNL